MKNTLNILLLLTYFNSFAVYTTNGGSTTFTNGSAWNGGSAPSMTQWDGSHDADVSHDLTYTGDLSISSGNTLTIKSGATLTITGALKMGWNSINGLVIEAGGKVVVNSIQYDSSPSDIVNNGTLEVTTTFTLGTSGTFTSTGSFTTGGDFTMSSGADVDLSGSNTINGNLLVSGSGTDFDLNGGSIIVTGNSTFNGDGNVSLAGDMTVGGDVNITGSGGASTTLNGTLNVSGTLTIDNNGDLDGYGIITWGSININPNCSPALLTCSGTGTSLDNNTSGGCAGTYADPPANPLSLNTCTSATLPVELIEFYLRDKGDYITLYWTTASEINNDRFEIYASKDGTSWDIVGVVLGAGNSYDLLNYSYQVSPEYSYFRIKQVDFDESYSYSNIIAHVSSVYATIIYVNGNIISDSKDNYDVLIYDIKGSLVFSRFNIRDVFVMNTSNFKTGVYIISAGNIHKRIYID